MMPLIDGSANALLISSARAFGFRDKYSGLWQAVGYSIGSSWNTFLDGLNPVHIPKEREMAYQKKDSNFIARF